MEIFVGNLSFAAIEADVKKVFEGFGRVSSAIIVMEKKGKKSRGFGFVEMRDDEQARAAIAALDGKQFMGRPLKVNPARPKTEEEREVELKKKMQLKMNVKAYARSSSEQDKKSAWVDEGLARTGGYKGGRRTRSFIRRVATGRLERPLKPWEKPHRPARPGRKPYAQAKPWQEAQGQPITSQRAPGKTKPWQGKEGERKPRQKAFGESGSLQRAPGKTKPWQGKEGERKPWQKAQRGATLQRSTKEYSRPLHKSLSVPRAGSKTRKKTGGFKR